MVRSSRRPVRRARHAWSAAGAFVLAVGLAGGLGPGATGCGRNDSTASPPTSAAPARPNVLWVVWDTVRADRMSLYGHGVSTTPRLGAFAKQALVFDDAVSTASYTVPSHASMWTGLLPSEHCANGDAPSLREDWTTIAELLRDEGYATFLYSENPHLSRHRSFAQGFEQVEHPWSPVHFDAALEILRAKLREDRSSELAERLAEMEAGDAALSSWNLKAAGELAERAVLAFLGGLAPERPYFVFVNYMEAHRPTIPPRRYREQVMSAAEVEASYRVDRSWDRTWEFTFGQRDFDPEEIALTRATYDAALLELDALFGSLLDSLERAGHLRNTVVVLTSDHGEHLGEHHLLDHQSTLREQALRVPLLIHYPAAVAPGRRSEPVMNFDLFPTLLALTGTANPNAARSAARDLLAPDGDPRRSRLSEETAEESTGVRAMRELHPGWDPTPWLRSQRALYEGRYKWVWSSNGARELYDLDADPGESRNLATLRAIDAARMQARLAEFDATLAHCAGGADAPAPSDEERRQLELLGYLSQPAGSGTAAESTSSGEQPDAPEGRSAP